MPFVVPQIVIIVIRIEYIAVSAVALKNNSKIRGLKAQKREVSRMRSLE